MKVRLSSHINYGDNTFTGMSPHIKEIPASRLHPNLQHSEGKNQTGENVHLKNIQEKSNFKDINRPTESVSFSGSAGLNAENADNQPEQKKKGSFAKKAALFLGLTAAIAGAGALIHSIKKGDVYQRILQNEKFQKVIMFNDKHDAKFKVAFAVILAGILKPICVLAMPGADKEDKKFTATKNAISAYLGYILSCAVIDPVSTGVNKFLKNADKYLGEDNELAIEFAKNQNEGLKFYTKKELASMKYKTNTYNTFKSVYKNIPGLLVAPAKAGLTIMLMPYVLKFLFGDKKSKELPKEQQPLYMEPLINPVLMNDINNNSSFDLFTKGTRANTRLQTEMIPHTNNRQTKNISSIDEIKAQRAKRQGGAA